MSLPKRFADRDEIAAVRAESEKLEPGAEAAALRRAPARLEARYGGRSPEPSGTQYDAPDADYYLRTATELDLKRLIVGGLEKVYELGKDFRNEGLSYKHVPEFTMVEWYEAYTDYRDQMERVERLIENVALDTTGGTRVAYRGHDIDLKAPWRRIKLVEALAEQG